MINEIKALFNDNFIVQNSNNEISIDLSERGEECKIKLTGGEFLEIKDTVIESLGNRIFKGILSEHHCDGIVFNSFNNCLNLVIIEYKNNLAGPTQFIKICNQLNATYLKVATLVNLVHKIEDINVVYIYVGKIPEKTQNLVLASKTHKVKLFNRLVRKSEAIIERIPFNIDMSFNDVFHKSNVRFLHLECNSAPIFI